MADNKNTEVTPVSEPVAPVQTAAPVTVVRERQSWAMPLIAALAVVVALVVGGVGGFAIARATDGGNGRPGMQQGQLQGGPGGQQGQGQQGGPGSQQGQQQGPGGQQGQPPRPDAPQDDSDDSGDDDAN